MRHARNEYPCALCAFDIYPGDAIAGASVEGATRWVHTDCATPSRPVFSAPRVAPTAPRPTLGSTPPAVQRASLAQARAQLDVMRADGWTGDDAAMLRNRAAVAA